MIDLRASSESDGFDLDFIHDILHDAENLGQKFACFLLAKTSLIRAHHHDGFDVCFEAEVLAGRFESKYLYFRLRFPFNVECNVNSEQLIDAYSASEHGGPQGNLVLVRVGYSIQKGESGISLATLLLSPKRLERCQFWVKLGGDAPINSFRCGETTLEVLFCVRKREVRSIFVASSEHNAGAVAGEIQGVPQIPNSVVRGLLQRLWGLLDVSGKDRRPDAEIQARLNNNSAGLIVEKSSLGLLKVSDMTFRPS